MKSKEYNSGDLTVVWKPELCIHSGECVKRLPQVFKPKERPWINPDHADNDQIRKVIDTCPSGALSYTKMAHDEEIKSELEMVKGKVIKNGPLLITGKFCIIDSEGNEVVKEKLSVCRCGASANKPYCDGSHKSNGFEG